MFLSADVHGVGVGVVDVGDVGASVAVVFGASFVLLLLWMILSLLMFSEVLCCCSGIAVV